METVDPNAPRQCIGAPGAGLPHEAAVKDFRVDKRESDGLCKVCRACKTLAEALRRKRLAPEEKPWRLEKLLEQVFAAVQREVLATVRGRNSNKRLDRIKQLQGLTDILLLLQKANVRSEQAQLEDMSVEHLLVLQEAVSKELQSRTTPEVHHEGKTQPQPAQEATEASPREAQGPPADTGPGTTPLVR